MSVVFSFDESLNVLVSFFYIHNYLDTWLWKCLDRKTTVGSLLNLIVDDGCYIACTEGGRGTFLTCLDYVAV